MKFHLPPSRGIKTYILSIFIFIITFVILVEMSMVFFPDEKTKTSKVHHLLIWLDLIEDTLIIMGIITGIIYNKKVLEFLRKQLLQRNFEGLGEVFNFPVENVKVLILPVSAGNSIVQEWLINYLKPEQVALVYTEKSRKQAEKLYNIYSEQVHFYHTLHELRESKDILKDPLDPLSAKRLVKKFINYYLNLGYSKNEIFVDITGGTAPTSIGAFQAAEEAEITTLYVKDGKITDPSDTKQGIPIFISKKF
ncbi:MAG: hypothetical protein ABWJ99_07730 [Caldimicrobium sp.]